jgi:hypothetical protein
MFLGKLRKTTARMKIAVSLLLRRVVWKQFADISEVLAASIIRAVSTVHFSF